MCKVVSYYFISIKVPRTLVKAITKMIELRQMILHRKHPFKKSQCEIQGNTLVKKEHKNNDSNFHMHF